MKRFLFTLGLSAITTVLLAQDTTVISTLTFDSITTRRGWWEFPPATEEFRKVLMVHTLKCDPQTTQDGYDCGEWDYLTYQFIHEHTGVLDSNAMQHPYFKVGNAQPDSALVTGGVLYDTHQRWEPQGIVDMVSTESVHTVGTGMALDGDLIDCSAGTARGQYLYSSDELTAAGLTGDPIKILRLPLANADGSTARVTVRMRNTTGTALSVFETIGLTTVFDGTVTLTGDTLELVLPDSFTWAGAGSNLLVEVAVECTGGPGTTQLQADLVTPGSALLQSGLDGYVEVDSDFLGVDVEPLTTLGNAITITVSMYGAPQLPLNTSLFEAVNAAGQRVLNVHAPWSNGRVYWDAGNNGGTYDRIDKAATEVNYEGQWNHWAFVKNVSTGSMKIYLNGTQWHSGSGKTLPMAGITRFRIGSDANGNNPFPGLLDDVNIFNTEVPAATIQAWTGKKVTADHPNHGNLLYSFTMDEAAGDEVAVNAVDASSPAWLMGTVRRDHRAATELGGAEQLMLLRPTMAFVQGDHVITVDSAMVSSLEPKAQIAVQHFAVQGNGVVPVDTVFGGSGGWYRTYDPDGAAIDSTYDAGTVHVNDTLDYFGVPYELVNDHEIGRYITPYGIGLSLGPDGFSWVYDVTEYQHLLHDSVELSAGNQQELIDLTFLMIAGDAPRPLVNVQRPWGPMRSYSYASLSDDTQLAPVTVDLHPDATQWMMRSRLTGHGHNSNDGEYPHCCEWKDNTHYLSANGTEVDEWHIWQEDDCANNPVYPQGGTWLGSREGWCPGDLVKDRDTELTPYVDSEQITVDYSITPVPQNNQGMGGGSYVVNMDLFEFGPASHQLDAEIYDVRRPSDSGYRSRENPICNEPVVVLRNAGATALTSVTFSYRVSGGQAVTHTWTGDLAHMERTEVVLPVGTPQFWAGDGDNQFEVEITGVNGGGLDNYDANDDYRTHFNMPVTYPTNFVLYYKTNSRPSENDLFVRDFNGDVVFSRTTFTANTIYRDTLELPPGCYELEFTDSGNDGLSYWADPDAGAGWFRFRSLTNVTLRNFEPEFGHRIYAAFGIGTITGFNEVASTVGFTARPNPSDGVFMLSAEGVQGAARIEVMDATGRLLRSEPVQLRDGQSMPLDLAGEADGIYLVRLLHEGGATLLRLAKR